MGALLAWIALLVSVLNMLYSSRVKQLISNPYIRPPGDHYNGVCCQDLRVPCKTNPQKISIYRVNFFIYIENNTVKDTRIEVFGDPVFMAAGYFAAKNLLDCFINEARNVISPENISRELDTPLSGEQGNGIIIVSQTALTALNNATYSTKA